MTDDGGFQPHTKDPIPREEIEAVGADWTELTDYVRMLRDALEDSEQHRADLEDIEEDKPAISDRGFRPNGWVGQFTEGVEVWPYKLDRDEFNSLVKDVQGWVELIGANTIGSQMPVSTERLIDPDARIGTYSRLLIEQTETILAGRPPTAVQRRRERGQAVRGQIDARGTMELQATGTAQVVSTQVSFTQNTPAARLLVRFHVALAREMHRLSEAYEYYEHVFGDRIIYHQRLLSRTPFDRLVGPAVESEFSDPRVLSEIRAGASPAMQTVIDLWESFKRERALEAGLRENFDTMVKPMGKTYELWCLGVLLELLAELTDVDPERSEIKECYTFGDRVRLHYDAKRSLNDYSQYFYEDRVLPTRGGRPDFTIAVDDSIRWIGDAKYKQGKEKGYQPLRLSDYQRFNTYLLDYLDLEGPVGSAFLYPAKQVSGFDVEMQAYTIRHQPLRPRNQIVQRADLADELAQILPGDSRAE
ncbi:hypothetical protein [Halorubrum lipolyticum]|uniref:Uncharacterized protein n=1 Tax=Halorubrum lipolyticum DSM 21995 TaxID=1227482 RepID=M0P3K3_9EURY|nr:hypothetical protein [Halorubrum lipolyticum]EMA64737.1 hypothetical protein C469_00735 [Halorubrum lipolyticum DSM 21995]